MVLASLLREHEDALRADLQQFYGIDLDRAAAGEHSACHVAALVSMLPQESRIVRIGNDEAVWTFEATLLAILINRLNALIWGMSDKRKRGRKPDLIGPSYLTKHKRKLAARALPIDQLMRELAKPRRVKHG